MYFDFKVLFSALAALCSIAAYVPYLREIFAGRTKPHAFTWLIWMLTTTTAAAGGWAGGGGWGAANQTLSAFLTVLFFLLSLWYGTKNITKSDTTILLLALIAIALWWRFNSPLLAVWMVTAIDAAAYIPTFRKSFSEPLTESLFAWTLFTFYALFALLALREYNALTVPYLLMTAIANAALALFLFVRRRSLKN